MCQQKGSKHKERQGKRHGTCPLAHSSLSTLLPLPPPFQCRARRSSDCQNSFVNQALPHTTTRLVLRTQLTAHAWHSLPFASMLHLSPRLS